ncbi:MAG: calcium/sodium antiporter [Gammaproteobacteria bacterium]|nr:MAG: calcium/sodium antiporter [Gammaproteobacteria bacterium]
MMLPLVAVVVGLILLVWSADRFIEGAAATATHSGMSPLLVGMLIMGFGTSAPELTVSAIAALDGTSGLALGNAIGSNIANVGLILGLTAIIAPIAVTSSALVRREMPMLIAISLLFGVLLWTGYGINRLEGWLLLATLGALAIWQIHEARVLRREQRAAAGIAGELDAAEVGDGAIEGVVDVTGDELMPLRAAILWLAVGLVLLVVSSRMLVWGAVAIAEMFGVSDLVIGLTIVAIGTSLPELAACVAASRKGENDLALGNIVGSNFFNILAVVGLAATIHPISEISHTVFRRDWMVMFLLTLAVLPMSLARGKPGEITRYEGLLLLVVYVGYTVWLVRSAVLG